MYLYTTKQIKTREIATKKLFPEKLLLNLNSSVLLSTERLR